MEIKNYNKETGWVDIYYMGKNFTARITDFNSMDELQLFLDKEIEKISTAPKLKFEIPGVENV